MLYHSRNLTKLCCPDFAGVTGEKLFILRVHRPDRLLPTLLPFLLTTEHFDSYVRTHWSGSTNKFLNKTPLMKYEFTLPPLREQRRIAGAVEAARKSKNEVAEAYRSAEALRRSSLEDLLDPAAREWNIRPLGKLVRVISGGTPRRGTPEYWNGDIPWVKTGEVNYSVIKSAEEHITQAALDGSAAKLCPAGTVVMAMYGQGPTRGRVAILGVPAATNQACALIPPNEHFRPRFLYYFLWRQYERIRAMAQGATQPNLSLKLLKGVGLPMVSLDEQDEVLEVLIGIESACVELAHRRTATAKVQARLLSASLQAGGSIER